MNKVFLVNKTTWDERGEDHYETIAVFSDEDLAEQYITTRTDKEELVVHPFALDPYDLELRAGKSGWSVSMRYSGTIVDTKSRNLREVPYDGFWATTHTQEVEVLVIQVDMAQAELRAAEVLGELVATGTIVPKEQS
jgi:hypothetical protein